MIYMLCADYVSYASYAKLSTCIFPIFMAMLEQSCKIFAKHSQS